jgi:hypothetical protein
VNVSVESHGGDDAGWRKLLTFGSECEEQTKE